MHVQSISGGNSRQVSGYMHPNTLLWQVLVQSSCSLLEDGSSVSHSLLSLFSKQVFTVLDPSVQTLPRFFSSLDAREKRRKKVEVFVV